MLQYVKVTLLLDFSVFPAEACETIGGEACDVEMYPEVKLKQEFSNKLPADRAASESIEREYLDYNSPKTYDLLNISSTLFSFS